LHQGIAQPLEAESLALTLVQRALGPRTTHAAGASTGRQLLADRVKLVLASDPGRRWTLADIAAEVAAPRSTSPRSSNRWKACPFIATSCGYVWRER